MTDTAGLARLQSAADQGLAALRAGDFAAAVSHLRLVADSGRADADVWLALAYACRGAEDDHGALTAVDQTLKQQPRHLRGLILKGDLLTRRSDVRSATTFYQAALRAADGQTRAPDVIADLRRAEAVVAGSARAFADHIRKGVAEAGFDPQTSSRRFARSLNLASGEGRIYRQEPRYYFFPGLADIGFRDRADLPWIEALEARTEDIRAELVAELARGDGFAPYVEARDNRPNHGQAGMMGNPDWGALYLWKDGVEQGGAARFPKTMAALADLDMTRIEERTPSILFSRLKPGARIPPHTGLVNTRLIGHLPLIVPPGCGFRVGDETRQWVEGQAWAFDDTIEHEAWNDGAQDRIILIFDLWKPEITPEERALITALFRSIDAYGGAERWDA
ncbi:aspartyl/asparaginyl beta-hydroxylase domain-containing protein [Brevundimonas lutea]|uniref:aspartyl/asparaginyl beta-hydroxylase domain-containing protein n=1 Tax=Brevundimonas lutea TaxID=2293980 RepID=UPI000F01E789|nr:aspartyl/asparaginyl beta-hydroxylase domain-containing protein [Brevundimonas lutea]